MNNFNPKEEMDLIAKFSDLDKMESAEMSKLGLSDPTKHFHSWWVLESRNKGIPKYNQILSEKKDLATRVHARRHKASRIMDESFNAPVTTNYPKWRKNMNRLDFMGVDTVPRERRIKRIEKFRKKAAKMGAYSDLELSDKSPIDLNANGFFNLLDKKITLSNKFHYPEHTRTFAHELSHAIDNRIGMDQEVGDFGITELLKRTDNKELIRAMWWTRDEKATSKSWAKQKHEQTAQFFANYMMDPRSMRREFPNLSKATEQFILPLLNKKKGST